MSIEAMTHVLNSKIGDSTRKLCLLAWANHSHRDGSAAWCSIPTVAEYAECSTRTVQRHLPVLLDEGWLREGDQRLVAHLPADRRPIVYDVAMSEEQRLAWQQDRQPGRRDHLSQAVRSARGDSVTPRLQAVRGDTDDAHGVTSTTSRGDTGVMGTVPEPSLEPSTTAPPPAEPRGVAAARWWWEHQEPRPAGRGAWHALRNACTAVGERGWEERAILDALVRLGRVPTVPMLDKELRSPTRPRDRVAQGDAILQEAYARATAAEQGVLQLPQAGQQ